MTCRGFIQLLLKVINVLFTVVGLAMIGYGIYMVVMYENSSSSTSPPPPPLSPSPPPPPLPSPPPLSPPPPSSSPAVPSPPPPSPPPPSSSPAVPSPPPHSPPPPPPSPPSPDESALKYRPRSSLNKDKEWMDSSMGVLQLRRTLFQKDLTFQLNAVSSFWSNLSTAWFLYVFIGVGVVIVLITCSGCIAASITNGCCLCCYSFFVGLVMIVELGIAAFIFFYKSWQDVIPEDSTGELDSIEDFIDDNFDILKWVGLGILILQAVAVLLAIILRALGSNVRTDYDSDDEYLATRPNRQPLLNRQTATGTAANVAGSENQSARTDTWSTRMREKYGLDMKDFSFKPTTEATRSSQSAGEKSWCSIM